MTYDQLDAIVIDRLQDSCRGMTDAIADLEARKRLEKYEVEDLVEQRKDLRATKRVLQYYMGTEAFSKFIKSLK